MNLPFWTVLGLLLCTACSHRPPRSVHPERADTLQGKALYEAGVSLAVRGDLTRAEQYLSAALHAGYEPSSTLAALLATCVRAGRLRSALSYGSSYLAEHPRDTSLRLFMASLYWVLRDATHAEQALRTVLIEQETLAEAHYLLALVVSGRDHAAREAQHHYRRYLELSPAGPHAEEARAAAATLANIETETVMRAP